MVCVFNLPLSKKQKPKQCSIIAINEAVISDTRP